MSEPRLLCAFCGGPQGERQLLITAPGAVQAQGAPVCICDQCVCDCMSITLRRHAEKRAADGLREIARG